MEPTEKQKKYTLHRYFLWANRMRTHHDDIIKEDSYSWERDQVEVFMYMSYWYGGLFVVIEGWRELGLRDSTIDRLLESPNVDLLRRYRNGVFHFQTEYYNERFIGFMRDGKDCVDWVRNLNGEFGRYFLNWFDETEECNDRGVDPTN